jgi:hypothetical protein
VPQPLLFGIVLMTLSTARRIASLHEETFQFFVHLEDVVRISCLGYNNVSSLYVLRYPVSQNLGFSSMDQPDLVIIVMMAVKTGTNDRDSKAADRDGTKPRRSCALVYPSRPEIEYGRFQPPEKTFRQTGQPVVQC